MAAAICAVAVAACAKEEAPTEPHEPMIGFCSVAADSRAVVGGDNTVALDAANNTTGFGVAGYCYRNGVWIKTFDNQIVTPVLPLSEPAEWQYSPLKYWAGAPYRFFAYYPHEAAAVLDESLCLTANESDMAFALSHTVANTWATSYAVDQTDFMLASPKPVTAAQNGEMVEFEFHHALSQVGFRVLKQGSGQVQVVDLSVRGIHQTGTASVGQTGAIVWNGIPAATVQYSYTDGIGADRSIPRTDIPSMLLLPQTLGPEAQVVLTVQDDYGNMQTLSGRLDTGGIGTWQAGKTYVYTLTVSSYLVLLDMVLEIADWVDVKINVTT